MCSICFGRRSEGLGKRQMDRGSRIWKSCAAVFQGGVGPGRGGGEKKMQAGLFPYCPNLSRLADPLVGEGS